MKSLDIGADDFISKPFSVRELMARVNAILRRTRSAPGDNLSPAVSFRNLAINMAARRVTVNGKEIKLTPTEYELLRELTVNAGKVLTHSYLLNKVWGPEYSAEREYLHVFIGRLRAKLKKDETGKDFISTVPAVGYKMETDV